MAALTTTDQFIELVRKSKLVDEKRLETFLRNLSANLPAKPRELAQLFVRHGLLTPFQASQLLAGKWRGFQVAGGKYKLLELLGVGGMGKVYLCEHLRMRRLVALKVLPPDKLEQASCLERFEREARAAGALDHPNIVRAFDIDQDPHSNLHFLVMEYVDGASLQEVVKKSGPLDITRACHYIAQAAEGLQHAHEAGWVHRDIKPGNLLLDRAGTIKLLDMGLARLFHDDGEGLTRKYGKDAVLGTADYLAPEQVTSSDVDIRADVYGLGATLYFLLTGQSPFGEGTIAQKLLWQQTRDPESVRKLRPAVPAELETVVRRMMAKKPSQRYQTPAEVVEALRPWTETPIDPPTETELPRLCPALELYTPPGASGPSSGSLSGLRRGARGPRPASSGRLARPESPAAQSSYARLAGTVAIGIALVGLGAGLATWFARPDDKAHAGPGTAPAGPGRAGSLPGPDQPGDATPPEVILPDPSPDRLLVSRDPRVTVLGRPDILPTLAQAVEQAQAGQTVAVLDETIRETVTVGSGHGGVRIVSGRPNGQRVLWQARPDLPPDQPLLRWDGPGGAQVKGFTFDGGGRLDTLVRLSGACAGLRLEDLDFTDAREQPLVLADCAAAPGQALTLQGVRFTTLRDDRGRAGAEAVRCAAVLCTGRAPLHLAVVRCRIEGMFTAGVRVEAPVEAELRDNRFFAPPGGSIDAVAVKTPAGRLRLTLAGNTAVGLTGLLRFDRLPAVASDSQFVLRDNLVVGGAYFVAAGSAPDAAAAKPLFAGSGGNRAGPRDCNGGLHVVEKVLAAVGDLDLNPATDHFLRPAVVSAPPPD